MSADSDTITTTAGRGADPAEAADDAGRAWTSTESDLRL